MNKSSTYLNITLTVLTALHYFVTSVNSVDFGVVPIGPVPIGPVRFVQPDWSSTDWSSAFGPARLVQYRLVLCVWSYGIYYLTLTSTCKLTLISAYFINMNELNDNIADNDDDDEFIDPDLLSYSTSTRGGEQLIYLNKVYQIKRNSLTHNGNYKIIWQCKDRAMCRGIPMIQSFRLDPLVQQDYDVQWLGINHQFNCHTNATSIVIEKLFLDSKFICLLS